MSISRETNVLQFPDAKDRKVEQVVNDLVKIFEKTGKQVSENTLRIFREMTEELQAKETLLRSERGDTHE